MNGYNGYSGDLRNKAQRWLNAEIASGRMTRPTVCVACGQNQGIMDMHAEDYSEPFAAGKTDEFHLCFACHMAVHCRFKNPAAWDRYRMLVRQGARTEPFMTRNFPRFISQIFVATTKAWKPILVPDHASIDADGEVSVGGEVHYVPEHWALSLTTPVERMPLDEIDGWLLKHTGKGWR